MVRVPYLINEFAYTDTIEKCYPFYFELFSAKISYTTASSVIASVDSVINMYVAYCTGFSGQNLSADTKSRYTRLVPSVNKLVIDMGTLLVCTYITNIRDTIVHRRCIYYQDSRDLRSSVGGVL